MCTDILDVPNEVCWGSSGNSGDGPVPGAICNMGGYATESNQNNFVAVRRFDEDGAAESGGGLLYVEYQTGDMKDADVAFDTPDFFELFNATADEWMLDNVYGDADPALVAGLHEDVQAWLACAGESCP